MADQLDLAAAVVEASQRNDMLPARPDDGVGGQVGKAFSDALLRLLKRGDYEPERAEFVAVPKSSTATRPAALLTLADRSVYYALVEPLRARVEKSLLAPGIAMWPRGVRTPKRWKEFEQFPRETGFSHVVRCDIANFYESISHVRLGDVLTALTGKAELVGALMDFLERVMRSDRGIPQGPEASDVLATAYLSPIDQELIRNGFQYARHGDDIRIRCTDYSTARRALLDTERAARQVGLNLSAHKSFVVRAENYDRSFHLMSDAVARAEAAAKEERLADLAEDDDGLAAALTEAGLEEVGWALFYHKNMSLDDAIDELSAVIKPAEVDVSAVMLRNAMERAPGSVDALEPDAFHALVTRSLVRLSAGNSPAGIEHCGRILRQFPDKAELVCTYINALPASSSTAAASLLCEALGDEHYKTGWEMSWYLRALLNLASLPPRALELADAIARDEFRPLIARVEAVKVLARHGKLSDVITRRLWAIAPAVYRADLIAALATFPGSHPPWVEAFLGTAKPDPVFAVVIRRPDNA